MSDWQNTEWSQSLQFLEELANKDLETQRLTWADLVERLQATDTAKLWYSRERAIALIELLARLSRLSSHDDFPGRNEAWKSMLDIIAPICTHLGGKRYGLDSAAVEDLTQTVLTRLQDPARLLTCATDRRHPSANLVYLVRSRARTNRRSLSRERFHLKAYQALLQQQLILMENPHSSGLTAERSHRLQKLSEDDRELLRLRFIENLTIGQVATLRGESYSAVAKRLVRLLARIRSGNQPP